MKTNKYIVKAHLYDEVTSYFVFANSSDEAMTKVTLAYPQYQNIVSQKWNREYFKVEPVDDKANVVLVHREYYNTGE